MDAMKQNCFYLLLLTTLICVVSCERQPVTQYPDSLVGYWASTESGQDFASVEVLPREDRENVAVVNVISNGKSLVTDLNGKFSYDAKTGAGSFTPEDDAYQVTIQAAEDGSISLEVKEVRRGQTTILYIGTLTRTTKPEKQKETINYELILCNYFQYADGHYEMAFVGTTHSGSIGMVQILTAKSLETLNTTLSKANGDFDGQRTIFIPNYSQSITEDDIVYPDSMSVTMSLVKDGYYNVEIEIICPDVIYHLTTSDGAIYFLDIRWDVEPHETVTLNQTYNYFDGGITQTGDTTMASLLLMNDRTGLRMDFITQSGLEKGTYPISYERKYGVATASYGNDLERNIVSPSYLAVLDGSGNIEKAYFLEKGEVTVDYPAQDTIFITGSATSHYGSQVDFSYRGPFAWASYHANKYQLAEKMLYYGAKSVHSKSLGKEFSKL